MEWHQGASRTTQMRCPLTGGYPGGVGGTGDSTQTATLLAQACASHGLQKGDSPSDRANARHWQLDAGVVQLLAVIRQSASVSQGLQAITTAGTSPQRDPCTQRPRLAGTSPVIPQAKSQQTEPVWQDRFPQATGAPGAGPGAGVGVGDGGGGGLGAGGGTGPGPKPGGEGGAGEGDGGAGNESVGAPPPSQGALPGKKPKVPLLRLDSPLPRDISSRAQAAKTTSGIERQSERASVPVTVGLMVGLLWVRCWTRAGPRPATNERDLRAGCCSSG